MKQKSKNPGGPAARVTDILWDFGSVRVEEYDPENSEVLAVRYLPFHGDVVGQRKVACVIGGAREGGSETRQRSPFDEPTKL